MVQQSPRAAVVLITALLGLVAALPIWEATAPADAGQRILPAATSKAAITQATTTDAFLRRLPKLSPEDRPATQPVAEPASASPVVSTGGTCPPCNADADCGRCCGFQSIYKCGLNHVCICQFNP